VSYKPFLWMSIINNINFVGVFVVVVVVVIIVIIVIVICYCYYCYSNYYEATSPLLSLLIGMMGGVLVYAQDPAQPSGKYGDRQCKERVEGLMVQKSLLQCCQGLTGCIPWS